MVICKGKRTRKPKQYPSFNEYPEYGHGTNCEICFNNNRYEYCIWEREIWSHSSNNKFVTIEDAIIHMLDNFGGTWKWE